MSLQEKTIAEFRKHFPRHTLREISSLTDIQLTRVFRLFNGAQMKLEEFEAFQKAILDHSPFKENIQLLDRLVYEVKNNLTTEAQNKIAEKIQYALNWHQLVKGFQANTIFNSHSA